MKKLLAAILLALVMLIVSGCGPKTERTVRREEQRNQTIRRNLEGLPQDIEVFWMTDEPLRLSRWEATSPHQ